MLCEPRTLVSVCDCVKMSGLWGEIPSAPEADSGIAALERDELTKPRGLEPEAPPLFQPSSRHYPPSNESLPPKSFQMDPIVLHTIRLIQHARKTRQAIQIVQQQLADGKSNEEGFPTVPPIPEYDGPPRKHNAQPPLMYMAPDFDSDFVRGRGEVIPEIDEVSNRILLRQSVATMLAHTSFEAADHTGGGVPTFRMGSSVMLEVSCAECGNICNDWTSQKTGTKHTGYDINRQLVAASTSCGSPDTVLETLTDVAHEFFGVMMTNLRDAADAAAQHGQSGFPDILEQVFHDMGIGSVTTLHDFYQTQVLDYHHHMSNTCRQLVADLEKLKQPIPVSRSPSTSTSTMPQKDTFNVIRIKEEPSADIQFPVLDENSEVSEAEQLLQLEGLSSFEITVEHESAGGLTTEVESKWPQSVKMEQDKTKSVESSDEPVNVTDTSGSVGGQDSVPQTPRTPRDLITEALDPGPEPGSISAITPSPRSPPLSAGGSKPKRRKTSS